MLPDFLPWANGYKMALFIEIGNTMSTQLGTENLEFGFLYVEFEVSSI